MVHHQRYHQLGSKAEHGNEGDEESQTIDCGNCKRRRPKLVSLLLLSLLSCSFILAPHLIKSSTFSSFYSFGVEIKERVAIVDVDARPCSSVPDGTICCDRSSHRTDICFMKGDVRTHSPSNSVFLYSSRYMKSFINQSSSIVDEIREEEIEFQHEKIKPYTRKWETSIMDTIDELDLVSKKEELAGGHHCDVQHDVPAVFFSTGGYTGNLYHEFNDGIIPLYITSQHFKRKVVFVVLEYHNWWMMKYGNVLSQLSDYPAIDFARDNRTHCFPEAIVGLRIHDELSIDPTLMVGNKSITDFHNLLDRAYWPRIKGLIQEEELVASAKLKERPAMSPSLEVSLKTGKRKEFQLKKPKLVIISRNGSRAILNEDSLVELAEDIGFAVSILRPERTTELAKIYRKLNSSDVMIGVHGAAMTHFLFMRPGSVFIQVVPLGTTWASETYYGEPAKKLSLKYIAYQILPQESSLYDEYDKDDPVLTNPQSVTKKGWEFTKKVYLDNQNVVLDLRRFRKRLVGAYKYWLKKNQQHSSLQSQ